MSAGVPLTTNVSKVLADGPGLFGRSASGLGRGSLLASSTVRSMLGLGETDSPTFAGVITDSTPAAVKSFRSVGFGFSDGHPSIADVASFGAFANTIAMKQNGVIGWNASNFVNGGAGPSTRLSSPAAGEVGVYQSDSTTGGTLRSTNLYAVAQDSGITTPGFGIAAQFKQSGASIGAMYHSGFAVKSDKPIGWSANPSQTAMDARFDRVGTGAVKLTSDGTTLGTVQSRFSPYVHTTTVTPSNGGLGMQFAGMSSGWGHEAGGIMREYHDNQQTKYWISGNTYYQRPVTFNASAPATFNGGLTAGNATVSNNLAVGNQLTAQAFLNSSNAGVSFIGGTTLQAATGQPLVSGAFNSDTVVSPARNDLNNFGDVVIQQGGVERVRFHENGLTAENDIFKLARSSNQSQQLRLSISGGLAAVKAQGGPLYFSAGAQSAMRVNSDQSVDCFGALSHQGLSLGLYGKAPVTRPQVSESTGTFLDLLTALDLAGHIEKVA